MPSNGSVALVCCLLEPSCLVMVDRPLDLPAFGFRKELGERDHHGAGPERVSEAPELTSRWEASFWTTVN